MVFGRRGRMTAAVFLVLVLICHILTTAMAYRMGMGIWDITGPSVELPFMGYGQFAERGSGLHLRLWSRAFIVASDEETGKRIVYVSTDLGMCFQAVKLEVVRQLQQLYGPQMYTVENVLINGVHSHAGPGGFSFYALYDITTFGFNRQNFATIVDGIVQSIVQAHNKLGKPGGRILINQGILDDANANRSPNGYEANPPEERAQYKWNTDHEMTLLRFENEVRSPIGMLNWFSVHGTAMNNTNTLISSDNKGYASLLFERLRNGNDTLIGRGDFVGAFSQTSEGDASPNIRGAFCPNGSRCAADSTCNGRNEDCKAIGPGDTDFESTRIIGERQFFKAVELFDSARVELQGPIDYRHTWIYMNNVSVSAPFTPDGKPHTTCVPALGYSFAAGTTDGPGEFDFKQNDNSTGNPFWNLISGFIAKPTEDQKKCQAPKPILIDVGLTKPHPWAPIIVPIQIFRIGQLFIIGVPGEFTTMSGRRLRKTILETLKKNSAADDNSVVVIAGLSNTYTNYITTFEEYQTQRYEGASTLFGPYTLAAYQQEFSKLATALAQGVPVPPGPTPLDLKGHQLDFLPPVIVDTTPLGKSFGSIETDVKPSYKRGQTVTVVFWGANPRNDLMTMSTYLTVERQTAPNQWKIVANDADWSTKFMWARHSIAESKIAITWDIPFWTEPGLYRIQHFGHSKTITGKIAPYSGASNTFQVVA